MKIFFLDDSVQRKPTRPKCGELVSVGGVVVDEDQIAMLEKAIDSKCAEFGFPKGELFKWSPGKDHWMRTNLIDDKRRDFFLAVIDLAKAANVKAVFVCDDKKCATAESTSKTHEEDTVKLVIERIDGFLLKSKSKGLIVVDRHSGDMKDEEAFLAQCLDTLRDGTSYVQQTTIIMPVLSSPSRLSRMLQLADVVTSCTLARVSGETKWSPPIFDAILPLFISDAGRIGGVGVKLHPWRKYCNLYHWLFKDTHYIKGMSGAPLPFEGIAFYKDENTY